MLSLLLLTSSFLNFIFYIYAIGFVVALGLEQIVRRGGNERDIFIVEYNRKYLWRNTWLINIFWFLSSTNHIWKIFKPTRLLDRLEYIIMK